MQSCVFQLLLIFCVITCAVAPGHGGHEVTCFHCEGHEHFPACLERPQICHHDEVCEILYGSGHEPRTMCRKEQECRHEIDRGSGTCGINGVNTQHGCEICCSHSSCVITQIAALQQGLIPTGTPVAKTPINCPLYCTADNPDACFATSHTCNFDEFCSVKVDHNGILGTCVTNHELHKCQDDTKHNHAECYFGNLRLAHGHCIYCCEDSSCEVAQTLSKFRATTDIPTTTGMNTTQKNTAAMSTPEMSTPDMSTPAMATPDMTTPDMATPDMSTVGVTVNHLDPLLNGNCIDLMQNNGCKAIASSVCKAEVGIHVCADTCGLCSLINSRYPSKTICQDQLIGNECAILQHTDNICGNALAQYTCPKTCQICGTILDNLVAELLHATSDPMGSTTQQLTTDGATDATTDATTTTTTTTVSTAQPLTLVMMTQVVTQKPHGSTSPNATCIDSLQGMDCSNLTEVCKNPIASQICRKFCGFCVAT